MNAGGMLFEGDWGKSAVMRGGEEHFPQGKVGWNQDGCGKQKATVPHFRGWKT